MIRYVVFGYLICCWALLYLDSALCDQFMHQI